MHAQHEETTVTNRYVSRTNGSDTDNCGTETDPCKTLYRALNSTASNVHLYIDGRGTQQDPYECLGFPKKPAFEQFKHLNTQWMKRLQFRSIILESINEDALISCFAGLHFHGTSLSSRITFSKLILFNTTLRLDGFSIITIYNCSFLNNTNSLAAIQVYLTNSKASVSVQETVFQNTKCSCLSVVRSQQMKALLTQLSVYLYDTKLIGNGFFGKNAAVDLVLSGHTNIYCRHVTFEENAAPFLDLQQKASYRGWYKEKNVAVFIRDSIFEQNHLLDSQIQMYIVAVRVYGYNVYLNIANTRFTSNDNGVMLSGFEKVRFENVTMNLTTGKALFLANEQYSTKKKSFFSVTLRNCFFGNNAGSLFLEMSVNCHLTSWNLTVLIQNTEFNGSYPTKGFATAIQIISLQKEECSQKHLPYAQTSITLEQVKVCGIRGKALSLELDNESTTNNFVQVKGSLFSNSTNTENGKKRGPIIHLSVPVKVSTYSTFPSIHKKQNQNDKHKTPTNNDVTFLDTEFENNTGFGSIVLVNNTDVSFFNSRLKNNFAQYHGATINVVDDSGSSLRFFNTTIASHTSNKFHLRAQTQKTTRLLSFYRGASLVIRNSSFTSEDDRDFYAIFNMVSKPGVHVDDMSSIKCAVGYQLKVDRFQNKRDDPKCDSINNNNVTCATNITSLKFYCQRCDQGFYNLERGHSEGLSVVKTSYCLPCPFGANCFQNISAKTNFWGYKVSGPPPILKFLPCPHEYCHRYRNRRTRDYNSCYGNRTGVLCGQCANGYTEELFTTKCRQENKCKDFWFWPTSAAYALLMAIYFVFKPPAISFLYHNTFWFRKCKTTQQTENVKNGYIKIIFYFYQIAELLLVKSLPNMMKSSIFITPVIALFNFKLQFMSDKLGCPFPGLTVVTKELFLSLKVITVIAFLLPIYAAHRIVNKARHHGNLRHQQALYMAVAMEILLLGYERLAETSLKVLHCVPIGNQFKLFYDGNIQCWQWWQYIFVAYVIIFVVPFTVVLCWGSLKLYTNSVSNKEFFFSCIIPLPYLIYWTVKHYRKIETVVPDENIMATKEVFHSPFRPPSGEHQGTLYWESVLIGRRFVLLCLYTFITDPMIRMFSVDCACVIIFFHHLYKRPYRNSRLNLCESISLITLTILSTISALQSTTVSLGIDPTGPNETHFNILQRIQIVIVGFLPSAFFVLVLFAVLSQVVRLGYVIVKRCSFVADIACNTNAELRVPFLTENREIF